MYELTYCWFTGLEPSGLPEGSTMYPESQDAAQGGSVGGEGKKKVPVKDERSWILKNWIFLVPAGLLVRNPRLLLSNRFIPSVCAVYEKIHKSNLCCTRLASCLPWNVIRLYIFPNNRIVVVSAAWPGCLQIFCTPNHVHAKYLWCVCIAAHDSIGLLTLFMQQ